jgi:hypothetical protein
MALLDQPEPPYSLSSPPEEFAAVASELRSTGAVDGVDIRVIYEPATDRVVTGFPYRP